MNRVSQFFQQNLVTLLHSLASMVLFVSLFWFFVYGKPDPDYNDLLSVLIGALVTIVTVMFSAVLVALQLASAQFSPRITRGFFGQNRFVQAAFYLFLFGIAYGFAVKFTYSSSEARFVYPLLPVSAAVFGFFLISFVLPRFVFYIADAINAASISRDIATRTLREIDDIYGTAATGNRANPALEVTRCTHENASKITLHTPGFLDKINHAGLDRIARQYPQLEFYTELIVGNFVTPGETIVKVVSPDGNLPAGLEDQVRQYFVINKYRSYDQDVLFGIRQLVDMGIKAISPAVNDPTTCVNCLHYIGVIVQRYTQVQTPSLAARKAASNLHYREFTFPMLLDAAFDQVYQWGKHDYIIVGQLLNTLTEIVNSEVSPAHKKAIAEQVAAFEIKPEAFELAEHRERVERYYERLKKLL
jgi:uncharacterized membrane protein